MRSLHELGVCYDDQGLLRNERTGEFITLSNIRGNASYIVDATTEHVINSNNNYV